MIMIKMKGSIETKESADIALKVREAQVRQLYTQTWVGLTGVIVISLSICTILWDVIPKWELLSWVGAMILFSIVRGALTAAFQRKSPSGADIYRWGNAHAVATAISGILWALPTIFLWPDNSPVHQMVWPICIVALSASAVATYCTWTASYLSFLILSTVPLSIRLLSEGRQEYIVIGLLGLFFIAVLAWTGKVMHAATLSAFLESIRNEALSSVLAEDKAQVEELNTQLQQEIAKRARSQEKLELQNQELERVNAQLTATKNNLERSNQELEHALASVNQLSGLLPICASCKKIRNDEGYWEQIEAYIRDHSDVEFSHGICPDCAGKLYHDYMDKKSS